MTIEMSEYAEDVFFSTVHGVTRYEAPPEVPDPDLHGRRCSNCNKPLSRKARLPLCRSCRNRCKSTRIRAQVARLIEFRQEAR